MNDKEYMRLALQLAVHVVIVQPPQVIREPFVLDCQQPEKCGLSRSRLSARSVLQNAYSILRSPLATRAPLDSPFTLSYGRCDFIVVAIRFIPVSSRFAECPCNPKGAVL